MTAADLASSAARWFPAASYAALAEVSLARPALVPGVFGGSAPTADSRTEIRAVYAGTSLALVRALLAPPQTPGRAAAVRVARDVNAAMALTRLASCVAQRRLPGRPTTAFLALEAALAVALAAEHRRDRPAG